MNYMWRIFWAWMPLGVAVTGLSILCYASAQQVLRQSINDVPAQLSQDTATVLSHGAVPADVVPKVTGIEDYQVALVTYRAACQRWPGIPITLRQGARVIEDSRRLRVASSQ